MAKVLLQVSIYLIKEKVTKHFTHQKLLGKKGEKKAIKANRPVRADWKEGVKKKQVGVSDMTLLTKITNEAINENLQKRWQNAEIYVSTSFLLFHIV